MKDVRIISLNNPVENFKNFLQTIKEIDQKAQEKYEEETI